MYIKKITVDSYSTPRYFFYLGLLTIGQTVFRPALSFTLSDWFFFISFLLTTSESLLKKKLEIKFPPYIILGLFFFTIGGIVSSCFAEFPLVSAFALIKYLYLIAVWFWLGTILLQKPEQIQTSIVLWTSSAAFSGLGALMQFVWEDIIPSTTILWSRMTGLTEHVNDLGALASVALIPAIMMLSRFHKNIFGLAHSWICVLLIAVGLILSVSMSGIAALVVSVLVWSIINRLTLKKILILTVLTILFFTAISLQSRYEGISILNRLSDISDDGFSSLTLQTRLHTYAAAWEVISDNPYFGVGLGPDVGFTETGYVVHNIFLLNWFESGLFGFLGILLIFSAIAFEGYKGIKDPKLKHIKTLGTALFSSYMAFLILGIAQPIYYKRFGWISAALLLALYSKRRKRKTDKRCIKRLDHEFL